MRIFIYLFLRVVVVMVTATRFFSYHLVGAAMRITSLLSPSPFSSKVVL